MTEHTDDIIRRLDDGQSVPLDEIQHAVDAAEVSAPRTPAEALAVLRSTGLSDRELLRLIGPRFLRWATTVDEAASRDRSRAARPQLRTPQPLWTTLPNAARWGRDYGGRGHQPSSCAG